jgi:hypothetical protein
VIDALIDRLNDTTQAVCKKDNVPADAWADERHAQSRGFHKATMRFKQALP